MKTTLLTIWSAWTFLAAGILTHPVCEVQASTDILALLPADDGIDGWQEASEPVIYKGEDLYDYINGGAEVFFEYGFKQVLVQEFEKEKKQIILDIYEMSSSEAARKIFTDRSSDSDKQLSIGQDARLSDYYLIFRSGPYFVAVTGLDAEPETTQGIQSIARAVSNRIAAK